MTLAAMQAAFWSSVVAGQDNMEADEMFLGSGELSAAARLAIYTDMFRARSVECLREDFPKLAALIAHDDFWELTMAYVKQHPSRDPSLSSLGRDLAGFVAQHSMERPDLSDLAALEWARAEVFEEANAAVLPAPNELAGPLQLIPALRRLRLQWDVCGLWNALEAGEHAPAPRPGPVDVIVWRKDHTVFHVLVSADEGNALNLVAAGRPLEEICAAFESHPNALERAARALGSWFAEGWIRDSAIR
jgi:hypothetical protein